MVVDDNETCKQNESAAESKLVVRHEMVVVNVPQ